MYECCVETINRLTTRTRCSPLPLGGGLEAPCRIYHCWCSSSRYLLWEEICTLPFSKFIVCSLISFLSFFFPFFLFFPSFLLPFFLPSFLPFFPSLKYNISSIHKTGMFSVCVHLCIYTMSTYRPVIQFDSVTILQFCFTFKKIKE